MKTSPVGENQSKVTCEILADIKKYGMLFVLEDIEGLLERLLVAEARDRLRLPVGAPVSVQSARQAAEQLWTQMSYGNSFSSTSHGVNLQSQIRLRALRILADDKAFNDLIKQQAAVNTGNLSGTEPEL